MAMAAGCGRSAQATTAFATSSLRRRLLTWLYETKAAMLPKMLAQKRKNQRPPGRLRSNTSSDAKVLVGKFPTKEAVVAESFTAKNVENILYPKANMPDTAIHANKLGRSWTPASSTSLSVQPQPAGTPKCTAHASGTGCCQKQPGTSRKMNAGKAMRPMAFIGESFNSVPMVCFITRSPAPHNTEPKQRAVPKRKLPEEANCPSHLASTVDAAQITPMTMHAHSAPEIGAPCFATACSTAVASGMQARMTWFTDSGMNAKLKLFRLMFSENATANIRTSRRC
mmetsp:Transcript_7318/g.26602  ORF Transcript_7318/g.26602 Transcript_7318/m.26602 type:complete len:283 (-) Transcript_7318:734-1582(-)